MAFVVAMCMVIVMIRVLMAFGIEMAMIIVLRAGILRQFVVTILGPAMNVNVWNVISRMAVP